MNKKILNAKLLVPSLVVLLFPALAAAIGMVSEPIVLNDVIRGTVYSEIVTVINSQPTEENFVISTDGAVKDWLSYTEKDTDNKIETITIPAKSSKSFKAIISVPAAAANGNYEGEIVVTSKPTDSSSSMGNSLKLTVSRPVSVTITDKEDIKIDAIIMPVAYTVALNSPIQFNVSYENTGNVAVTPSIKLKISKDGKSVFNAIFPYPENTAAVMPAAKKEFAKLVEWQTNGQELGNYMVAVETLVNDKSVQSQQFNFKIVETLAGVTPQVNGASSSNFNLAYVYYAVGGILVLAAGLLGAKKIFKKKPSAKVN